MVVVVVVICDENRVAEGVGGEARASNRGDEMLFNSKS